MSVWERAEVCRVFRCFRCGACCRGAEEGLELTEGEAQAIARGLAMAPGEFLARYCLEGEPLRLARREGVCALWSEAGCLAWAAKPRACSVWPFPERLLSDEAGLAAVIDSCPGFSPMASLEEVRCAARLVQAAYPRK